MKTISTGFAAPAAIALMFAAALPFPAAARYADDFDGHYEDLLCAEDDCDCLEPDSNRFKVVSPCNLPNTGDTVVFTGAYDQVQAFFENAGQTDDLPIVPPTALKVEKFMRYTPYAADAVVATLNGRAATAYQVAANAVMSGCSADLMPICIAMVKAMGDESYLREISGGSLVPMAFVNGPVGRQVGVDCEQGMTTEEVNFCLARFIGFALLNLGGVSQGGGSAFGAVQALVFSENDEACMAAGWQPYHVQQGYDIDDSTVTMTSFSMWGNNSTPATDWPEEIMKLVAWDVTEKNLGALGSASTTDYAETKRTILVTPPVALALSALYRSKENFAGDLACNARRPMSMRAFACCYCADAGGTFAGKSLAEVYGELVASEEEGARITPSPAWLAGITNPKIMTGATLKPGNAHILVTGDASRNKTQVMPGGKSVTVGLELPDAWDPLLAGLQRKNLFDCLLPEPHPDVAAPISVPPALSAGTYRILDPATGSRYLTRSGRLYFDSTTSTLHYYKVGGGAAASTNLDAAVFADFIAFIENLGYNSSFTISRGTATDSVIRFSSNPQKLENNTAALSQAAFAGTLTLHANSTPNSNAAGGVAVSGSFVRLSDSVTAFDVDLDEGPLEMSASSTPGFVTLNGAAATVNTSAPVGSAAIIGAPGESGTYRTLTFTMRANGTYDVTYNACDTLSLADSTAELRLVRGGDAESIAFAKTDVPGVYAITAHCPDGESLFSVSVAGVRYGSDAGITNSCDRLQLSADADECALQIAAADYYTFRFDSRDGKLTVAKDVARAGLCSGGTIENVSGVYVVTPDGAERTVAISDLPPNPALAFAINGRLVPGEAFEGFGDGASEGEFSLALKPPVPLDVHVGDAADGVSVRVSTFENLRYVLKRATDLHGTFVPVNANGAEKVGTGGHVMLIDASLDRPQDRAFYRIAVTLP